MLHGFGGAYGCREDEGQCELIWNIRHREGWNQALINAEKAISTYLGGTLCPKQVCNEIHLARSQIRLKHPVSYLGTRTFTAWTEDGLVFLDESDPPEPLGRPYFYICESELGDYDIEDVEYSYPDDILLCYTGKQELQAPCIEAVADCGLGEPGWKVSWEICQLVSPLVDEVEPDIPDNLDSFIQSVKWRIGYVDASEVVEIIGDCSCGVCANGGVTATVLDAEEGLICLSGVACSTISRVKIDYGTAYRCAETIDPTLEDAVVILAVVLTEGTIAKPCGCDNVMWDRLLEEDPTARNDFGSRLRFGGTIGGMRVMRALENYLMDQQRKQSGAAGVAPTAQKTYLVSMFS